MQLEGGGIWGRLLVAVQEASDVKAVANVILSGAWPEG